jgi:hypothetical protein
MQHGLTLGVKKMARLLRSVVEIVVNVGFGIIITALFKSSWSFLAVVMVFLVFFNLTISSIIASVDPRMVIQFGDLVLLVAISVALAVVFTDIAQEFAMHWHTTLSVIAISGTCFGLETVTTFYEKRKKKFRESVQE